MYCYNCGKEIAETVKFCPYCGAEQKQPQQPVQQPQQQEPQPQPIQQQPAQWQNPRQQDTQWQAPQQPTQWQNPPAANNSGKNNSWQSRLPIILAAVALVVVVLLAVRAFHNRADAQNELKAIATTEPAATEAAPTEKVHIHRASRPDGNRGPHGRLAHHKRKALLHSGWRKVCRSSGNRQRAVLLRRRRRTG